MMKAGLIVLLVAVCYVQCRKIVAVDKTANTAFINMEGGGVAKQPAKPAPVSALSKPASPVPTQSKPASPVPTETKPASPAITQTKPAPAAVPTKPVVPTPAKPAPSQVKPVPVNPSPVAAPASTPGPGSVKQLVTFYDSQGKASVIRPYSYSQAVKQG